VFLKPFLISGLYIPQDWDNERMKNESGLSRMRCLNEEVEEGGGRYPRMADKWPGVAPFG
jgi:hypothetical protein